jgi:ribosomal protein S18 acetylase RimI-like enzyme
MLSLSGVKCYMKLLKLDLNKHDIKTVSEMIYETDNNLFGIFLSKEPADAKEKLIKLIVAGKNCYGMEHVHVAEDDDGEILGILVAFRGDQIKFLEEARIFRDNMKFVDFFKLTFIKPVYDRITASKIDADDLYIGNLVVANGLRGQGIGSKIIEQSFIIGIEKKCKRVLLDVIFENQKAKKFYEKIGFRVCGEKKLRWSSKSEGTYGMEFVFD